MTIIAGFSVGNYPVLVGDLLLTDERTDDLVIAIPSSEDINTKMPKGTRRITGLRQKLNIIDDRLAICWAGSRVQAYSMLKSIRAVRLEGKTTLEAIEQVITFTPMDQKSDLSLIGLLIDENGSRFFTCEVYGYNCDRLGEVRVQGSGTKDFVEILKQMASSIEMGPETNAPTKASGVCLAALCQAKGQELFTGSNLIDAWGGGFELATIAGNIIKKIGNYLNIHFRPEITEDNSVRLEFIPRLEKVDYWRDTNVIHVV